MRRRDETLWCEALPTTQVDIPSLPPLLCLCVCVNLARFGFLLGYFSLSSPAVLLLFLLLLVLIIFLLFLCLLFLFCVFILSVCFLFSLVSLLFLLPFFTFYVCVSFSVSSSRSLSWSLSTVFSFFFLALPYFDWFSLHLRFSFPSPSSLPSFSYLSSSFSFPLWVILLSPLVPLSPLLSRFSVPFRLCLYFR